MKSETKVACYVVLVAISYPLIIGLLVALREDGFQSLSVTGSVLGGLLYIFALRSNIKSCYFGPLKNLPVAPDARFALGHGVQLFSPPVPPFLLQSARSVANNGLIRFYDFFHLSNLLMATSPEAAMEVFNANPYDYQKPTPVRKFLARILGNGLIIAEGKEHKVQRKAVAAAFQGKHIMQLVPIFWDKSLQMTDCLAAQIAGSSGVSSSQSSREQRTVEIGALASRCTLDIIGKAGFNRDFNTLDNSEDELAKQYETITNPDKGILAVYFAVNMFLPPGLVRLIPWKMNQRINEAMQTVRLISKDMIAERKVELDREKKADSVDILSVLMRSTDITEEKLVDECLTFLAAGHETTSSAISWASYVLGMHQDVQEDLRRELQAHIPAAALSRDTSFSMTASLIDSLPLLNGVCFESLRLYPTVPVTSRWAIRDTKILDQLVPKGTEVLVAPWVNNRLESIWGADAEAFRPGRWMGSEEAATYGGAANRSAFVTFIHGPRSCIGQGFAKLEMKCILAALLLRFRFELAEPDVEPIPAGSITIKPKYGMRLVMTEIVREK